MKSPFSCSLKCHNHELTKSTAHTKYSIFQWWPVSRTQSVSHLSADIFETMSLNGNNYKLTDESCLSGFHPSLQNVLLQVLLKSRLIIACKCISKHTQSQPQSASLRSLNLVHQVHVHTCLKVASQCISKLHPVRPHCWSLFSFNLGLQFHHQDHSITAS